MADEYTPSMDRVRDLFSWAYAWRTTDDLDGGETDLSRLRETQRAEFDRALAAHDREVIARTRSEVEGLLAKPSIYTSPAVEGVVHALAAIDDHTTRIRPEGAK